MDDSRLTIDDLWFTIDDSRLMIHDWRLMIHDWWFTIDDLRLMIHDWRLTIDDLRLMIHYSRFTIDDSRFTIDDLWFTIGNWWLAIDDPWLIICEWRCAIRDWEETGTFFKKNIFWNIFWKKSNVAFTDAAHKWSNEPIQNCARPVQWKLDYSNMVLNTTDVNTNAGWYHEKLGIIKVFKVPDRRKENLRHFMERLGWKHNKIFLVSSNACE